MEYRSSEVKAGMFIFIGVISLMVLIASISDIKDWLSPKQRELQIVFNFADGLETGAPVRYAGLEIGRVKEIMLEGKGDAEKDRVIAILEIDPKYRIKKDSTATIKTAGLMGGFYVDIKPGDKDSPELKKGDMMEGQDSFEFAKVGDAVNEFVRMTNDLSEKVKKTLITVNQVLSEDVKTTLTAFRESMNSIDQMIIENRESFRENLQNILQVSRELSQLLTKNKVAIQKGLVHFSSLMEKGDLVMSDKIDVISRILDQLNHATREAENLLADNREGVTHVIRNMETGSEQITNKIISVSETLDKTLHQLFIKIDLVSESIDNTFHQGNAVLVDNRRNLMQMIKNLKETSVNLKELSGDIKRNPWKLIRKADEKPLMPGEQMEPGTQEELRMKRLDKAASR